MGPQATRPAGSEGCPDPGEVQAAAVALAGSGLGSYLRVCKVCGWEWDTEQLCWSLVTQGRHKCHQYT